MSYRKIRGWLSPEDVYVFDFLLDSQGRGDLVEIGAYEGASAILIGLHKRTDETFTVCDLFGLSLGDTAHSEESNVWYGDLTRDAFERNYLSVLPELPEIVQRPSSEIVHHVGAGTCRFVHLDGSHLYDYVRGDLEAARTMLAPDGIVAVDDWRTEHTPGVMVAVMERVTARELHPIVLTRHKFYAVWDSELAQVLRQRVVEWTSSEDLLQLDIVTVGLERWPRLAAIEVSVPAPPMHARVRGYVRRLVRR